MGKPRGQSLASRKRAKKMNATLEHAYSSWDNKNLVEGHKASWDTAVPRKMQILMQSMERQKNGAPKGKSTPGSGRQYESGPRPKPEKPNGAQRPSAPHASPAHGRLPSQKGSKQGGQGGISTVGSGESELATSVPFPKEKRFKKEARDSRARFGQTNNQPPELKLTGRLATGVQKHKAGGALAFAKMELARKAAQAAYATAKAKRQREAGRAPGEDE